ncbi:MAG: hypothetical protein SFZ23_13660 [Planctomycetota bacterium]|nr:hypothetical protein [Planctomycetota bacterium]
MKVYLMAIAAAAFAGSAVAGTVQVNRNPGEPWQRGTTNGGGFRITPVSGDNGITGGRGGTATSFISFCIELNENLPGRNYTTQLSNAAQNGGVGGATNGLDPISAVTRALYTEFRRGGTFGGIAPAGTDASSWTTDLTDALQLAIWFEENEVASFQGNSDAAALHAWAVNAAQNNSFSSVRVLQMFNPDGSNAQDVLTLIPLPGTASLAAVGLMVVGARGRRR